MPVFDKSPNSMFETLSRSRQAVLGKKNTIPPPGTLARPGMKLPEAAVRSAPKIPTSVLERAVDDLLDVDGDPILVIDDELDVSAITPEDGVVDETPTKLLGVRADTAVVFGIGLCLVVAIAYFAGRTTTKPGEANKVPAAALVKPNSLPLDKPAQAAPIEKAAEPAGEEPAATPPAPAPKPVVADGSWEIHVVTTSDENAAKVIKYFNDDMLSPTYGKGVAYAKKGLSGAQVRIKGFEKDDATILAAVQADKDPTNGRPGAFKGAVFRKISKK